MIVFPLDNWLERGVLIAIAVALGLIWSMFQFPQWWRAFFERRELKWKAREAKKVASSVQRVQKDQKG